MSYIERFKATFGNVAYTKDKLSGNPLWIICTALMESFIRQELLSLLSDIQKEYDQLKEQWGDKDGVFPEELTIMHLIDKHIEELK